jgi:hypothetical protein
MTPTMSAAARTDLSPGAYSARLVAALFANDGRMTKPSLASLPLPGVGPYGAAFVCMFMVALPDVQARDYVLYEPELAVAVDVATLRPAAFERWREPAGAEDDPLTYRLPEAVRGFSAMEVESLQHELLLLTDELAPHVWDGAPLPDGLAAAAQRYDQLFRALTPLELIPYYERLDGRFLAWLEASMQRIGRIPDGPLEPRADLAVPPPVVNDPWDTLP